MSGIMVYRKPGMSLPDDLLDQIYASSPNVFGYVFLDGDVVSIDAYDEPKSKDSIKELLGAFPDEMLLVWDNYKEGYHLDDLQPNEIHETLAVAAVGNFSNHKREHSARTDTYFMVENVVVPRVQQLFDLLDEDPDKISAALDKDIVKKEFTMAGINDAVIAIVSTRGENKFKLYGRDGSVDTYEWGKINTEFGYTEKKEEPEKKTEDMGTVLREKRKSRILSKKDKAEEVEPKKEPISEKKEEPPKKVDPDTSVMIEVQVPANWNHMSNREKKAWQNKNLSTIYSGWRQWKAGTLVRVSRPAELPPKAEQVKPTVIHDITKLKDHVDFKKDTLPHLVKSSDTLPVGSGVPSVKPSEAGIVSINERTAFKKNYNDIPEIKELLKIGAAPIMSVEQLKMLETKTPSFYEVTDGWAVEYLEVLSNEKKLKMIKEHSDIALAALNTLLIQNRKHQQEIAALKNEEKEKPKEKMSLSEKMRLRMQG